MKPELLQRDYTHKPYIKACGPPRREHRRDKYGQTCCLHCACGISSAWHQDWEKARIGLDQNHAYVWYGFPSKDIPEDGVLMVRRLDTGVTYRLVHNLYDWCLFADDGSEAIGGQKIHGQLRRILDEFFLEIVADPIPLEAEDA